MKGTDGLAWKLASFFVVNLGNLFTVQQRRLPPAECGERSNVYCTGLCTTNTISSPYSESHRRYYAPLLTCQA